jgi:hypothetical protein
VALLGWLLVVAAVCAGVGWLYLLRDERVLASGPVMTGALPLEELAGAGGQPLLRMAVAWLPAGFAAGLALAVCTRMRATFIALSSGLVTFVILFLTTAESEAVSRNEHLSAHLGPALNRTGVWTATALVIIGALLAVAPARARRARPPEPSTTDATSSVAA